MLLFPPWIHPCNIDVYNGFILTSSSDRVLLVISQNFDLEINILISQSEVAEKEIQILIAASDWSLKKWRAKTVGFLFLLELQATN